MTFGAQTDSDQEPNVTKFKNSDDLRASLAQATADWIEADLAYEAENGAEIGLSWGSPIEERMFLGLAIAAQVNRYGVDLYRSARDRVRLVLDDLSAPPRAQICKADGSWEDFVHIPKRIGYAPHNELDFGFASGLCALRVFEQVRTGEPAMAHDFHEPHEGPSAT